MLYSVVPRTIRAIRVFALAAQLRSSEASQLLSKQKCIHASSGVTFQSSTASSFQQLTQPTFSLLVEQSTTVVGSQPERKLVEAVCTPSSRGFRRDHGIRLLPIGERTNYVLP